MKEIKQACISKHDLKSKYKVIILVITNSKNGTTLKNYSLLQGISQKIVIAAILLIVFIPLEQKIYQITCV